MIVKYYNKNKIKIFDKNGNQININYYSYSKYNEVYLSF